MTFDRMNYGIRYEMYLTQKLNYVDLLTIRVDLKATQIKMVQDDDIADAYKLIIVDSDSFKQLLDDNSLFNEYIKDNEDFIRDHNILSCVSTNAPKNVMVKLYDKYVKHIQSLPEPLSHEEFKELTKKLRNYESQIGCTKMYHKDWMDYMNVSKQWKIQLIIHNNEVFDEIKSAHKLLLDQVYLSDRQTRLIQNVINHPKLTEMIIWHGLNLFEMGK